MTSLDFNKVLDNEHFDILEMFLILFNVLESEGDDVLEMVSGNVFPWYQTRSEIIESSILNKLMPKWSDPDGDFKLDSEKIFRHLKDTSKGVFHQIHNPIKS